MKLVDRYKNITFHTWSIPGLFLFITIIAFGLFIRQIGFYWDDWAKSLVNRLYGVEGYWAYYAYDRPLSAWTHILLFPILGETPINWHVFTLLTRWLSGVMMWWSLSLLWPNSRRQVTYAALLFLVYPSFTMQSIAVTFHQQWMQYVMFFLSIGCMILAFRREKFFWFFTVSSLVILGLQITITEYFIPLELLRPLILWFLLDKELIKPKQKIVKVMQLWAPYLLLVIVYIGWRQFFMQLVEVDPYQMKLLSRVVFQPFSTIKHLAKVAIIDIYTLIIACWSPVIGMGIPDKVPKVIWMSWLVAIPIVLVVAIYFERLKIKETGDQGLQRRWITQAAIIGFMAIFLGMLPAWLLERSAVDDFHANRYTLPAMWGVSLIFICLLEIMVKKGFSQQVFLGVLIGFAVTFHIRTADQYRDLWQDQVSFYWQLHWRAPYIEYGTAIMMEEEPFPNQGLFSTSSAINFMYPQPRNEPFLAYYVYTLRPRYNNYIPDPLQINFNSSFRSLSFRGSTPNSLLIYYDPDRANCLWVFDPERDRDEPGLSRLNLAFMPTSNLDQIKLDPIMENYPPREIIGAEPKDEWCYFYQRAELARQYTDWGTVSLLGDEAVENGFIPNRPDSETPHEWLVFIEAYVQTGNWDKAIRVTTEVSVAADGNYDTKLCRLWETLFENTISSPEGEKAAAEVKEKLSCE